jgi:hypothetical protein
MAGQDQRELDFAFDAADLTQVLGFGEKILDPAVSLLTADTADERAHAHRIEVVLSAAGKYVRTLLSASPFSTTLAGKDPSWVITPSVPLILLGELAWCELTMTAAEKPLHPAFSTIKGATDGIDWKELYRSALQAVRRDKQFLKLQGTGIELCGVRWGYGEESGYFDAILNADAVKAVLSPHAYAALAYLATFQSMMHHAKLPSLPVRFIANDYRATSLWAAIFNGAVLPEHLRTLSDCLNKTANQRQ